MYPQWHYTKICKLSRRLIRLQEYKEVRKLLGFRANGKRAEVIEKLANALPVSSSSIHFVTTDLPAPKMI